MIVDTSKTQAKVHMKNGSVYRTIDNYDELTNELNFSKMDEWTELDLGYFPVFIPINRIESIVPYVSDFQWIEDKKEN